MSRPPARAIILAAGRGSRLRPLTDHTPKPLVRAGGRPLIGWGLALLRAHGIEDVVINVHHLREQIVAEIGDGASFGLRIRYSVEEELLDTGGGIRQAAELFGVGPGAEDGPPLLVLNADVVTDIALDQLLVAHRNNPGGITLVLRDDPRAAAYGLFGINEKMQIRRFLGAGAPAKGLREYMFASVQVLDPRLIRTMPQSGPFSTMHGIYPRFFQKGVSFHGFVHTGRWYTSDTAEDLQQLTAALEASGGLDPQQR
ncbi:MAG: nucleotidyltransferase family protein [Deltaproteobacteria bacterium]